MTDRNETAFRRYVIDGATVIEVSKELNTSTASVIRWSRKWEAQNPTQAHELRRVAAARIVAAAGGPAPAEEPRGFMARLAVELGAAPTGAEDADAILGPDSPPARKPSTPPAPELDEDAPLDELPEDADALTIVKRQIRELRRYIEAARKSGQIETVQRFTRSLVELTNALRQLERAQRRDDGLIVASKADIDAAIKEIDEKVHVIEGESLVCAECGRKMRRRKAEEE